jgi:hypothetical protein
MFVAYWNANERYRVIRLPEGGSVDDVAPGDSLILGTASTYREAQQMIAADKHRTEPDTWWPLSATQV